MIEPELGQSERIMRYQLEVSLAELELAKSQRAELPDVEKFLNSTAFRAVALRFQELIWTIKRLTRPKPRLFSPKDSGDIKQAQHRIFFDLSAHHAGLTVGGIKRLVQELGRRAEVSGLATLTTLNTGVLCRLQGGIVNETVDLARGDVFVIICFFWEPFEKYKEIVARCKKVGAEVVVFVHDIVPALYPGFMNGPFHRKFKEALIYFAQSADLLVTLSKASAVDIELYIHSICDKAQTAPIKWFYMGADAATRSADNKTDRAEIILRADTYLSVGSVLPHKGVPLAIKAFEHIWAKNIEVNYLIVGKSLDEWPSLSRGIKTHPEFGKRLHWLEDCNDEELSFCYKHAYCYIQPSIGEGYGIPLAEAAASRLPIIASDIPVFREIGSPEIVYFSCGDAHSLSDKIAETTANRPTAPTIQQQSWDQSFLDLHAILAERH